MERNKRRDFQRIKNSTSQLMTNAERKNGIEEF